MKVYEVEIAGVVHTIKLSDEDAKARGLSPVETKTKKSTASNKARSTKNKSA